MTDQLREKIARTHYELALKDVDGRPNWDMLDFRDPLDMGIRKRAFEFADAILSLIRAEGALVDWRPLSEADKSATILAISESHDGPLTLNWFKYNGGEAWRDWDGDPHFKGIFTYIRQPEPPHD
jgi:hypothetical protein